MSQNNSSETDWERVVEKSRNDVSIPFSPEDGPYNPNNEVETREFFDAAIIGRRRQKGGTEELI